MKIKTIQRTLFKSESKDSLTKNQKDFSNDKNEGLGFNPKSNQRFDDGKTNSFPNKKLSQERESMADEQQSDRREIVDVDAWMNTGGKGFFVKIEGKEYITSIDSVKALLNGEKQGVKLGMLKSE